MLNVFMGKMFSIWRVNVMSKKVCYKSFMLGCRNWRFW